MSFLNDKEVGKRLIAKRKETNLSARKFAISAGVNQSQYLKVEKGLLCGRFISISSATVGEFLKNMAAAIKGLR